MKSLRTPDQRFNNLPGYPFKPHYLEGLPGFDGLRLHYLDEPGRSGETWLCLHGQPTWSYLYRRMIPVFSAAGHRAVAPDFFGFGRSDKPADEAAYTFDFHRNTLIEFIKRLDLKNITLVCQDWGGILGLTLPMEMPERFKRLLVMNTILTTGDAPLTAGFLAWRDWCAKNPDMAVGRLMARSCKHLTPEECAAYDAPFPDASYKAGVRRFPQLVPDHLDAPGAEISRRAVDWWSTKWKGSSFMAIGVQDPVISPIVMRVLHSVIRNCPPPLEAAEAGHFVQEWGEPIARAALAHFKA